MSSLPLPLSPSLSLSPPFKTIFIPDQGPLVAIQSIIIGALTPIQLDGCFRISHCLVPPSPGYGWLIHLWLHCNGDIISIGVAGRVGDCQGEDVGAKVKMADVEDAS